MAKVYKTMKNTTNFERKGRTPNERSSAVSRNEDLATPFREYSEDSLHEGEEQRVSPVESARPYAPKPTGRVEVQSRLPTALLRLSTLRGEGIERMLEEGAILLEVKKQLNHADWCDFRRVAQFSSRAAEMRVRLAEQEVLKNPHYRLRLPVDPRVLEVISRLDSSRLQQLIDAGTVSPKLRLAPAKRLMPEIVARRPRNVDGVLMLLTRLEGQIKGRLSDEQRGRQNTSWAFARSLIAVRLSRLADALA